MNYSLNRRVLDNHDVQRKQVTAILETMLTNVFISIWERPAVNTNPRNLGGSIFGGDQMAQKQSEKRKGKWFFWKLDCFWTNWQWKFKYPTILSPS